MPLTTRKRSSENSDNTYSEVSKLKKNARMKELSTSRVSTNLSRVATKLMMRFLNSLFPISLERLKLKKNTAFSTESCVREKFNLN